jgi:hypothetical protein
MEKLEKDKHSSLIQKVFNYGRKKFYNIGPWARADEFIETLRVSLKSSRNCSILWPEERTDIV